MIVSTSEVSSEIILPQLNHKCIESFSAYQSQDQAWVPEILCRITQSINQNRSYSARNFQFNYARHNQSLQRPDPRYGCPCIALIREGETWALVKFAAKPVRRSNGAFVKFPSVANGSFRLCDPRGEVLPRPPPPLAFSSATIGALKRGLGVNAIFGGTEVSFADSGCIVISEWMNHWKTVV